MAKAKSKNEVQDKIDTFTLGDTTYDVASIPEEFRPVFHDANVIEQEVQRLQGEVNKYQTRLSIAVIARDTMTTKFKECLPSLKVVEQK